MEGIKKIADFEDRFFKIAKKKSNALLKGDIVKELDSGKDFPIATKADLSLLIGEIKALKETHALIEKIGEELEIDFSNLLKSKSFDDFIDNFKELVKIDELKKVPEILRDLIDMEIGLVLSFITAINNVKGIQIEDYSDSFNQYFFGKGYRTVSEDLIVRPKFPKISMEDIESIGNQINAERYIRDMTRIVSETTGDQLYDLRPRYGNLSEKYKDTPAKEKLINWYDSFGDLAEASLLPVIESIINGGFGIELNPLVAASTGTFCSVTVRKAVEHSYLTLLGL